MIDALLKAIRSGIHEHTGLQVVHTDLPVSAADKLKRPYYSHKVITYIPDRHTGIHIGAPSGEDIAEKLLLQPTLTVSFNSYDKSLVGANTSAIQAWEWFKYIGVPELGAQGYVVVNVTDLYDRTVPLSDTYEYRYGFDVMIRLVHEIDRIETTIETWMINKEE